MQSTTLKGANETQCPPARTNHCHNYYIFTYAKIVAQPLAGKYLKAGRSHRGFFSAPNAAMRGR